ncbi:hypothetical protein E4U55_005659 [Claviceps digitariae]|nr:hypothetical protein E4U55_005659 [Claviceps digitariae]
MSDLIVSVLLHKSIRSIPADDALLSHTFDRGFHVLAKGEERQKHLAHMVI